jgi:hypothetical protein
MSSVALPVCTASDFTSEATTAKPLPASPARAASMVASASKQIRLVRDVADEFDHIADLLRAIGKSGDLAVGLPRFLRGLRDDAARLRKLTASRQWSD